MKKLILFVFVLLAVRSYGQITITAEEALNAWTSEFNAPQDSYLSNDTSIAANLIAMTGASQTWNFGGVTYTLQPNDGSTTHSIINPSQAALSDDADFAGATHVQLSIDNAQPEVKIYNFYKIDATGFYDLGITQDSAGTKTKVLGYSPGLQMMKFPLAFGTTWTSTSEVHSPYIVPGLMSISVQIEGTIDGYGTLVVPEKSGSDCLRAAQKLTQTITILGQPTSTSQMTYLWYTKSNMSASISKDQTDAVNAITYAVPQSSGSVKDELFASDDFTITANPASAHTTLNIQSSENTTLTVQLMDVLGRDVRMVYNGPIVTGKNALPIDVTTLPGGTYYIRASNGINTSMRKLVVTK